MAIVGEPWVQVLKIVFHQKHNLNHPHQIKFVSHFLDLFKALKFFEKNFRKKFIISAKEGWGCWSQWASTYPLLGPGAPPFKTSLDLPACALRQCTSPLPLLHYICKVLHYSALHENFVFSVCSRMGNAAYIIYIIWSSISGLNTW